MGDKIRFGIIGIGGTIGSTTRILADEKNAELVALADPDSNRREGTLDEIEGVQIFDDYKEMLQQAELGLVTDDSWLIGKNHVADQVKGIQIFTHLPRQRLRRYPCCASSRITVALRFAC